MLSNTWPTGDRDSQIVEHDWLVSWELRCHWLWLFSSPDLAGICSENCWAVWLQADNLKWRTSGAFTFPPSVFLNSRRPLCSYNSELYKTPRAHSFLSHLQSFAWVVSSAWVALVWSNPPGPHPPANASPSFKTEHGHHLLLHTLSSLLLIKGNILLEFFLMWYWDNMFPHQSEILELSL